MGRSRSRERRSRDRRRDDGDRGRDSRDRRDRDRDRGDRRPSDRDRDRRDRRDRSRERRDRSRDRKEEKKDKGPDFSDFLAATAAAAAADAPVRPADRERPAERGEGRGRRGPGDSSGFRDPVAGMISIPPPDKGPRPGDWTCGKCGANVFAVKSHCHFCGAKKARPEPPQEIKCDCCREKMPRCHFSKITCAEVDETDVPPLDPDEVPPYDPGYSYTGLLMRRNEERGFGFAEHHALKLKYQKDIMVQRTDMDKIIALVGMDRIGEGKMINLRIQFGIESKNDGFNAHSVCLYEVLCKKCMEKKLPILHKQQMEAEGVDTK